jgi:hypothetical protein
MSKGMIIRGAFAMAPVKRIHFKDWYVEDFNGNWDDLPPRIQEHYARLGEIFESTIQSGLWKEATVCLCTIQGDERFAHGQCLAFHTHHAVGIVHPDGKLTRGPWVPDSVEPVIEGHVHQYIFNKVHLNPVDSPFVDCETCGERTVLVDAVNYYAKHGIGVTNELEH